MKLVRLREQLRVLHLKEYDTTVVQTKTLEALVSIVEERMEEALCCADCYRAGKRPDHPMLRSLLSD